MLSDLGIIRNYLPRVHFFAHLFIVHLPPLEDKLHGNGEPASLFPRPLKHCLAQRVTQHTALSREVETGVRFGFLRRITLSCHLEQASCLFFTHSQQSVLTLYLPPQPGLVCNRPHRLQSRLLKATTSSSRSDSVAFLSHRFWESAPAWGTDCLL